jgi:tetratricopeptide (TPR) repeat protein
MRSFLCESGGVPGTRRAKKKKTRKDSASRGDYLRSSLLRVACAASIVLALAAPAQIARAEAKPTAQSARVSKSSPKKKKAAHNAAPAITPRWVARKSETARRIEGLERLLQDLRQDPNTDYAVIADVSQLVGHDYMDDLQYDRAEEAFARVILMDKKRPGVLLELVSEGLGAMAELRIIQHRHRDAEPLLLRAIPIAEHAMGVKGRRLMPLLASLAAVRLEQGSYADAEKLYQRAIRMAEKHGSAIEAGLPKYLSGLASLYTEQGEYIKADLLLHRALSLLEEEPSKDAPSIIKILNIFARMHFESGESAAAEQAIRRSIDLGADVHEPNHPEIAASLHGLGMLLR